MTDRFLDSHSYKYAAKDGHTPYIPGWTSVYQFPGGAFNMHYVPGGLTFPTDAAANSFRDDTFVTVENPYWIAETAVTYRLWSAVLAWALTHGYIFASQGSPGGCTDDYGETLKAFGPGHDSHPVTSVSWRDSIVWCNALTEYLNLESGANLNCVYLDSHSSPVRDSRNSSASCGPLTVDSTGKGFRLPLAREWELAARYQNGSEWTPGNHVSGDISGYCFPADSEGSIEFMKYAWFLGNSNVSDSRIYSTRPVGQKAPNALGLYDLCGNVWEWCFDSDSDRLRVARGGSWLDGVECLRLGFASGENPAVGGYDLGFRIARSG